METTNILPIIFMVLSLIIVFAAYAAIFALAVAEFVFKAKAVYTMAKRRELKRPWLAWIPLANAWVLGKLADEYCLFKEKKTTKYAIWMFITSVAFVAAVMLYYSYSYLVGIVFGIVLALSSTPALEILLPLVAYICLFASVIVLYGVLAIKCVYRYKGLHKVLRSCDTKKSFLFLMLSIFTPIEGLLLYFLRNDDLGYIEVIKHSTEE